MNIIKTNDKNYPIKFDDSWGEGAYLYHSIVMDDGEWREFIKELEKVRAEIKNEIEKED